MSSREHEQEFSDHVASMTDTALAQNLEHYASFSEGGYPTRMLMREAAKRIRKRQDQLAVLQNQNAS